MSERCKLRNLVAHGIYDNFYLRLDLLGIIAVTVLSWVINQTYDTYIAPVIKHTHTKSLTSVFEVGNITLKHSVILHPLHENSIDQTDR